MSSIESKHQHARLYFMGRHPKPLIDPRDVPRGPLGYPLPNFAVFLGNNAVGNAVNPSVVAEHPERQQAEVHGIVVPTEVLPELEMVA